MTDKELNTAIANCIHREKDRCVVDYCNNTDNARLVEDEIERRGLVGKYMKSLTELTKHKHGHVSSWFLIRVTPRQRCEAALKAMFN